MTKKTETAEKPYLMGIAGGSGSGKTYFLRQIRKSFTEKQVCIVSQDNYYRKAGEQQTDEKGILNFDLPEGIDDALLAEDVETLMQYQSIDREEYMFNRPDIKPRMIHLQPAPVIIVEGLFIFHFNAIKRLLDLKLFLDSRDDIRLKRRLQRDQAERDVKEEMILYQWHHHVIPAYNRFLLPYRDEADVILTNNASFDKGLKLISDHISKILEG